MTRFKALAASLVIIMVMPTVVGHGASDYQFIMRNQTLQPSEAKLLDNTTMIFFNVADENRTIKMDIDKEILDMLEVYIKVQNIQLLKSQTNVSQKRKLG